MDARHLWLGVMAYNIALGKTPGDEGEPDTFSQNVPEIPLTVEIIPDIDEQGNMHYRSQPIEPKQ